LQLDLTVTACFVLTQCGVSFVRSQQVVRNAAMSLAKDMQALRNLLLLPLDLKVAFSALYLLMWMMSIRQVLLQDVDHFACYAFC